MLQCPACFQLLEALTSRHCVAVHGMGKADFIRRYGKPHVVPGPLVRNPRTHYVLRESDFTNYQLFDRRFRSPNREFHVDRSMNE